MSNATSHSPSAPASKAARSFSRFVRTSVRPVVFKLSRKLSVTYWPGRRRTISAVLLALLSGFVPGLAGAGPTGGQVVAGTAKLLKPTSTTTQINQTSQNVIINWQSFSIGAGEAVRFVQPSASAVALNRVIGSDPSRIFGTLQANGKVFLVNNAGVYFAPGASVDVGGLVATSMNISNGSFLSGKYKFEAGAQAGALTNDGQLRGAFVVLAAPQVTNAGSIVTTGGATALAAGGRVSLDIAGDKLVTMSVDAAAANAAVVNSGSVSADGGKVFMSASSANAVLDTVINTSGIVRAGSIGLRNGQIVIDGADAGVVKVSGTLTASGAGTGRGGGAVKVLGDQVALLNGARIDVSGDTGGGSALVGGDLHGAGGVKTAALTRVEAGAVINADALASGDGGKVVVWADQHTGFAGAISAKGGAQGGDGGFVETSGKATLAFAGKVDTTAARGATGSLLLDPTDITINNTASSGGAFAGGTFAGAAATSTLNVGDLTTALGSTNVIVDTTSAAASTGNIVVGNNVTWNSANSLTLKADANITNNANITSNGSGAINLNGNGVVSAGTLTSTGGDISIAGTAGGSSKAGSVIGTTIASAGGNVSIQSNGAITTGAINAGSGAISIIGSAGVAITGALGSTNGATTAIVVTAGANGFAGSGSGGNITVAGGSVTVSGAGRATLYTGSIAGSTGVTAAAGAGSGRFRYNSAPGTDNFSAALGTGVNVVYREQPTLTLTGTSPTVTYGDADPTFGFNYVGLRNGDTSAQALTGGITVSSIGTLSGSGHTSAGTYAVTPSGGADQLGYNVAYANGTFTVAKKAITSSGSAATGKTYDGTTVATVDTSTATFGSGGLTSGDGLAYAGDAVSINNAAATSGVFADKNAGVGKAVTISGLALQGADAGNYTITGSATATIARKTLTATATAADKVYDGNTTAATALTLSGLVGTEALGVTGTGTFNAKDVLTANTVTVNSVTLADGANGGLISNYTLGFGQTTAAHITPKALTASATAADKVYDGNVAAATSLGIASGLVGGETVTATGSGAFNSKDVLAANQVTVNSVALANGANGGLASNYDLATGQTATAHITPKALTATVANADKTYDGGVAATAAMNIAGLVGTEVVTGTGTGSFDSKDVLTASQVTVGSVVLSDGANGGLASNYSTTANQVAAAHITPKSLTASLTASDKVYDGNTAAATTLSIASGLVGTETVAVTGTGAFNTKDVLTANQVTLQSVALADGANGGLASNYQLATGQSTAAIITPKALTATVAAADKAYDGSTTASAVMNVAGLVGAETVTATGDGVFDSKDVVTASQVTVNAITLADGANGGLASNYSVGAGQTGTAHITPKSLTATVAASDKTYDGNTAAATTVSIDSGLVGSETLIVSGSGLFNTKDVVTASQVTVDTVALANGANGGLASNYSLGAGQTVTAHITPKALSATAAAADKAYDGSLAASAVMTIDAAGLVGSETVTGTGTGVFDTKDVVTASQVTVDTVVLANGANGGVASNYSLGVGQTGTAHITPKALTATATAFNKVYDGNTNAAATLAIASGLVSGETITATATGAFDTKDVATASTVTVQSLALADGAGGGLASNYSLATGQSAAAHITPKSLTAIASAPDKVYDGNLAAAPVLGIDSGLVGAETVSASGSGVFNTKDVATANQVTVQSVALADGANGGLASNYNLGAGQTAVAHITPKALTATVAASDKTYDGSTAASAVMNVAGLVGAETVSGTATGDFNSKDVLTANLVTVNAVTLADGAGGGLASNYSLGIGQTGTAHITPKVLTATAAASDKTYDGSTAAATAVSIASGLVGAETLNASATGVFNTKDVVTANQVTVDTVALADGANGGLASNYSLAAGQTATAHITPKALTATAVAPDKVYDGDALAAPIVSITGGLVGAETVTASGSGTFNSKDVLSANQVTVQSVTLADGAGGLASNYSLAPGQTATAHITPKALTVAVNAADKVYDGNADASGSLNIASGLVGAETVIASGTSAFNSKDVLTANLVTVQSLALVDGANGGLASNYSAGAGQTTTAHITPKSLTAIAAAADKVYDGGTAATAVMNIDAAGLVGAETVTGTGSGVFDSKDVANAGVVTVQSVVLADGANGGLASNYSLATGQTGAAHITPKSLTATATASDKVYDGNLGAATALSIASGLVGAETLGVTGAATFNTKDVLTANLVTVNAVALADGANGGLASNYSLGSGQSAAAHITPKALTATAAAPNKTYDGNLVAAPTLSIASGLVGAETVSASGTGVFNSKDVLAANLVTVQSVALANGANGGIASNYSVGAGQTVTAHITPKALTANAAAGDKVYDGGLGATAVMNIAAGLVGTETVTGIGTGVFNSKDVLNANLVTVQAVTLANGVNGGLASNYSLGTGQTGVAHITSKALTATATAPNKVYDGNIVAAPVLSIAGGLVGAETLGVSATGAFNSKDVLAANLVTVNSVALANGANGGIASNYSLAPGQTAAAHVTPKALSATVAASGKVYDGTTTASNVLTIASGLVGAEKVTATGSAVFNSKDVLSANQVTVQAAVLANGANGGLASNYSLAPGQVAGNVRITAKPLTASAAAADKVYDGNLAGSAVMNIDAAGLVGSETVSATGTGLFNSKDVGSAAAVTVNTVQLANGASGGLASNYSLGTGQLGAARITRRPSVTWVGGASGNWADAANWEVGAIPDLANVANVIIPAGKSVLFNASVPSQKGVVQLDGIDGAGALVVSGGTLNVANALKVGSYTQSAGAVDASTLGAAGNFNQTGGKLVVSGNVDIVQASGSASFGDISAANLSLKGGGATQAAGSAVLVSDTLTLDAGAGDVLLGNKRNDFGKVVIASAHDVTLSDINGLDVKGDVSGTLTTASDTLTVGPTKVGGNFIASALGAISQTGALDVAGSTIVDSAGSLRLDDKKNALRGRVKVTAGGDVLLASAGGLAIGGDVGGKLVLTASGPVIQTAGDALHVSGTSSIDAGAGAVTLTEADNHFSGPLSVRGGALSVADKGALALGESSVAGNLSISSGGALTQTGKLAVSGASAIAAKGQAVTLGDGGNTFGGKMTLGAASATVNAAGPLAVDSDVDGALTLGSPDLKLNAANALNLHLNTGAAAISAGKSISIDGNATGPLAVTAGGAVTQGGALVAGGTTSISAPGHAISLTNAGNDFGGELSLTGATTQVTDKNGLILGSSDVKGTLQLTAKGDVTQKGVLNVGGATAIDTTGAVVLGNEGNDFAGPVSATASSVMLKDKNILTLAKLAAAKAELSAGSELQVAPGGVVDAPDIALSLSPTAVKGAIGTPANKFEVRKGARIVLGANTPAVPTYIGGDGAQVVVGNLAASINYSNEAWSMDARTRVNSSIANILQASQKKADSNAVLIERGLPTDLTVPIPYPHEGAMRTKAPACIGNAADCPAEL